VLNKQNPLFSYVKLAPDGAEDGRLEVHEVFGLQLSADLVRVVGLPDGTRLGRARRCAGGDDWVGLTRAFLHAGARHVVATLWPVDDWATAVLMERFYGVGDVAADPARGAGRSAARVARGAGDAASVLLGGVESVGGAR